MLTLNTKYLNGFVSLHELDEIRPQTAAAHLSLHNKTGAGNDFLGWLDLPENYDRNEFARIKQAAQRIQKDSDVLVVIGIGGSYLGARAAIEYLFSPNYNALPKSTPDVYFAGCSLSPSSLKEIITMIGDRDFSINIASKSGTTTEPALAFRVLRDLLEKRYGKEGASSRIYATTDKARGTLKTLADKEGWETFVIPDDVGGRFSVLTAVGLLPLAAAGCDIDALMAGAAAARLDFLSEDSDCHKYAALRNILYRKGKSIEVLAAYEPALTQLGEWYKQLFGESEGKDGKGLFPASMIFSTDLHSLGQFVQDGSRNLFETVITFKDSGEDLYLLPAEDDFDGLNFLCGQNMSVVNEKACAGTTLAHVEGGCPVMAIEVENRSEKSLGYLVYFFEKACAVSGYMLGVNPFDQPGVESYKKNMFALLGKPGFEDIKAELEAKL